MKKYTLETLKKENELFDSYYGLDESDVVVPHAGTWIEIKQNY